MPDARRHRSFIEAAALAVFAALASRFQALLPITLGPEWLLAAAYGVPFTAGLLLGVRGVLAVAVGIVIAAGSDGPVAAAGLAAVAAEAGLAAWWARRGLPFTPGLNRPRDVLALTAVAVAAACGRGVAAAAAAAAVGL